MDKVLNQEQIDNMVRAARGSAAIAAPGRVEPTVVAWDPRRAGQIGREQMRSISQLHEGFARNLTNALGAYLRVAFEAALVSAEHLSYGDFLQRIPEVTYLATCNLVPVGVMALLQMDLSAAFPLVDVLLGGEGKGTPPAREITAIEEEILETVVRLVCRELQKAWQSLALEFQFDQRQQPQQVQRLMPMEEKTLSLSFEITMADSKGTLNFAVPAVVSNALLRKISAEWSSAKPRNRADSSQRLRTLVQECLFPLELGMTAIPVPLSQLVELAPDKLLVLKRRVNQPGTLLVSGEEVFVARVAGRNGRRAAQVLERCARDKQGADR